MAGPAGSPSFGPFGKLSNTFTIRNHSGTPAIQGWFRLLQSPCRFLGVGLEIYPETSRRRSKGPKGMMMLGVHITRWRGTRTCRLQDRPQFCHRLFHHRCFFKKVGGLLCWGPYKNSSTVAGIAIPSSRSNQSLLEDGRLYVHTFLESLWQHTSRKSCSRLATYIFAIAQSQV